MRALPLGVAAERSVHYFCDYYFFCSAPHTFLPEGVVIGLWNWNVSSHNKNKIRGKNNFGTPLALLGPFFFSVFLLLRVRSKRACGAFMSTAQLQRRVKRAQTSERGPPSAPAEFLTVLRCMCWTHYDKVYFESTFLPQLDLIISDKHRLATWH